MKLEKKFFLDPEDDIEVAKECIKNSEGESAILNIPKNSILGKSTRTFKELKKYSDEEEKEFLVESVDDHILELASLAGIRAVNPVFRAKERAISDIYPVSSKKRAVSKHHSTETEEEKDGEKSHQVEHEKPDVSIIFEHKARIEERKRKKEKNDSIIEKNFFEDDKEISLKKERRGRIKKRGKIAIIGIPIVVLFAIAWGAMTLLPRADVTLVLKKEVAQFDEIIEVSVKAATPNTNTALKTTIPGELLSAKKNMFIPIDADKKETVSYKAKGTLVVSNAYSASPQTLVATTRFEAPNGIIFRLDERVTIPGAKISGKTTTPGLLEVNVTADSPGESSNLSPTKGWKIPGFKGTPRYEKFIVENTASMKGGFVGDTPVVSDEQKEKTLTETKNSLSNLLNGEMLVLMSDTFKLLDKAQTFQITKNEYQATKDDPNKFGMFIEGEMKRIVFKEEALKDELFKKHGKKYIEQGYTTAQSFDLSYGTTTIDFVNKKMEVSVKGSIAYIHDINPTALREDFKNRNESELRQRIFSLPGIENATISLWPFWVRTVPESDGRIEITVR